MTEYELDGACYRNPLCDCDCMRCALFARWKRSEMNK